MIKRLLSSLLLCFCVFQMQAQTPLNKEKQLTNIESFAKLYGYVRYFHPSDEAADLNWEKFIYYGIKEVENANNQKALVKKLNDLFNPIAPAILIVPDAQANGFNIKTITPANKSDLKEITWQHYGLGNQDGLYQSARTNRTVVILDKDRARYGTISTSTDAKPYRGKNFRLRAFVKTDGNIGQGQMWLRIDCEGKKMGFFDNMDNRPVKSKDWKKYEIKGKVDANANEFVLGAFMGGLGKTWVDQFNLEVEDNGKWTSVPLKNASFESDASVAADWNAKAPGYSFKVQNGDAPDGKHALLISSNATEQNITTIFDTKADFGAYFTKPVGNGISCVVPLVLMGSKTATYPAADASKLKALKSKLDLITISMPDHYVPLTGVVTTWNVFEHFFPYKEEAKLNWPEELPIALSAAYDAKTAKEYGKVLRELTEKLKDGHVSVSFGEQEFYAVQVDAALVEGKVIVSKVDKEKDAANTLPLKAGDEVISVDGVPALERLAKLKSGISGSEQWKNNCALGAMFDGKKDTELVIKIKRRNEAEQEIRSIRKDYRENTERPTIKKLDNGIFYINIGNTEMKDITALLPELVAAKGIICDLRGYPRGNHQWISHLLSVPDTNKWMFVPQIIYPDYEKVTYKSMGWDLKPETPHITAKVIFLTGGGAISYAESYMGFIKHYKLATIVGQPTAGANGNVNYFNAAGNYTVRFTGMKVKLQDGGQLHSIGIQPDVFVERTIKGVTEGRDEYMEKALELLK